MMGRSKHRANFSSVALQRSSAKTTGTVFLRTRAAQLVAVTPRKRFSPCLLITPVALVKHRT